MAWAYAALAGYQIISGLQQAETIRETAKLNKQIADMNAEFAQIDAYNAELEGYTREARYQSVVDATLGSQKVAFAAADVDVSFGTAKEIQKETKLIGALNQLDIRDQAHKVAMGYKTQASNIKLQGQLGEITAEAQAVSARNLALIGAASTGLSGYSAYKNKKG